MTDSQIKIAYRWRKYWKIKQKKLAIEAAKLAKKKAAAAKKGKKGKSKKTKKNKKKSFKKDNAEEEVLSGTFSPTVSTPQNEAEDN